jgi:hypothetical protein
MGIRDCTQKRLMRNELESRKTRFLISLSPLFFVPFHSNCRDLQGADAHPGGLIKSIVSSLHDATHTIDDWFDNAVGGDGAF